MKRFGRTALVAVAWALIIFTLVQLGFWQLHRAQALNKATAPKPDQAVVALTDIASAGMNLPIKAVNRIVSTSGVYEKSFIARDQKINGDQIANLDVRILRLENNFSILVVRGIAENPIPTISSKVEIVGRIYPRQNVDRAFTKPGELSRIDPALIVSKEFPFLYDGYIVLKSEKISDGMVTKTELIQSPQISQRVAGFYWQHISYVVIWWFMALLVLVLPLFPQMRQRSYISIAADQSKKAKVVKK
ncbi:MAG: SURF1 family cytochrome oxidase biogenesis protein [Actinomycetes bacterium]|jgi:cytochrome oxidase assembly protein ShyY1